MSLGRIVALTALLAVDASNCWAWGAILVANVVR